MKKILLLLALIATLLLAFYCLKDHTAKIEGDITSRLTNKMTVAAVPTNIQARVDGRDVVLTGLAANESERIEAEKVAEDLYGVRAVDNQIKVQTSVITEVDEMPPAEMFVDLEPLKSVDATLDLQDANLQDIGLEDINNESLDLGFDAPMMDVPATAVSTQDATTDVMPEPITERVADIIVPACQGELASILEKQKINFNSGRATIQSGSFGVLNRLATAAKNCKESVISIHGYTDSSGDVNMNTKLSLSRAKSVGKYLISKGVRQEIRVVGNGPNDPIADNATPEGRAQNRRIEFKVTKPNN